MYRHPSQADLAAFEVNDRLMSMALFIEKHIPTQVVTLPSTNRRSDDFFVFKTHHIEWNSTMNGKRRDKNRKSMGDWNGFVDVRPEADDKKEIIRLSENDPTKILGWLEDITAEGYKLTLRWNEERDHFQCSVSCYTEGDSNYKYTMTSRAPSAVYALTTALYKHYVICGEEWPIGDDEYDKWG